MLRAAIIVRNPIDLLSSMHSNIMNLSYAEIKQILSYHSVYLYEGSLELYRMEFIKHMLDGLCFKVHHVKGQHCHRVQSC